VLSWMLVPPLLAWLESLVGQSIFVPRNLLVSLPAVALMLAWTIADVTVPSWVCWPALAVLLALRALQVGPSYAVSPEDWRTATAYVLDRARAGDCIAFYPSDARMPFQYYVAASAATGRAPRSVLPAVPWSVMKPYVEVYATLGTGALARLRADCERMWLVWSHQGQRRGTSGSRADYARWVRLRTALQRELGGAGRSVSFGYAAPVTVQLFAGRGRAS